MKHELANNARRLFCLSIEELAYNDVINKNEKITDVAKKYARSPSTIRRWLDKVQEGRS
jgi:transposase